MKRVTVSDVNRYLKNDWIADLLVKEAVNEDADLTCHQWLCDTPAKRFIYQELYGDLLKGSGLRILDVGGGLSSLTRILVKQHQYTLVDLMAHDDQKSVGRFLGSLPEFAVHQSDWFLYKPAIQYDVIIANDLFPNVDQRLELFLEKFLPCGGQLRLALTFYNDRRFYMTKRIGADEVLCVLAWNGERTRKALEKFSASIGVPKFELFDLPDEPIFPNKRQICLVALSGDCS
jgi:hypothetical protein